MNLVNWRFSLKNNLESSDHSITDLAIARHDLMSVGLKSWIFFNFPRSVFVHCWTMCVSEVMGANVLKSLNVSRSHSNLSEVSFSQSKNSEFLRLAKKNACLGVSQSLAFTISHPLYSNDLQSGNHGITLGVWNGLCEHLRACEQCIYFCEHEQWSNMSCEQQAFQKIQMASSKLFVNFLGGI